MKSPAVGEIVSLLDIKESVNWWISQTHALQQSGFYIAEIEGIDICNRVVW